MGSLRKPLFSQQARRGLCIVTLAVCVAAVACALSGCAQKAEKVETDSAAEVTVVEQERAGFIAHGANYGKSETVAVTTDLSGDVRDVAVTEWIKNPEGLETISDATSLNALIVEGEGVRYQQNEDGIVWTTGGQDVRYAGATDQELPFAISYEYKLDGEVVDPSTLQNVQGQLEINIRYDNKTSSTVTAGGASYDVQMPYVMASIVAFDPEHARNIEVDSGSVVDMNGQQLAVGVGMPGLSRTLRIEDQVSLPENVTIKAEVLGFDMPNVTTMVTAQGLELVGGKAGEAQDGLAGLFGKVSGLQQGFSQLSAGIATMGEAVGKVQAAQSALEQQISAQAAAATEANKTTLAQHQAALAALDALCTSPVSSTGEQSSGSAPEGGQPATVAPCGMCDNCVKAAQARAAIQAASQSTAAAQTALASLPSSENPTSQSIVVLNAGLTKLTESLGQLQAGMGQMSQATQAMGQGIADMLSQAQGALNSKLDLVEALGDYVEAQGAFCGSVDGMPASTMFIVTAQAE